MMISKELLSEVLGLKQEIELIEYSDITKQLDYYHNRFWRHGSHINIHELAYKCKKWGWKEGYEIVERKTQVDVYKNNKRKAQFIGDSNVAFLPNRVFESGEWIREQKAKV